MKRPGVYLLAVIVIAVAALVLRDALAQGGATRAPAASRIAVCDIVQLFNNYQRRQDLEKKLEVRLRGLQAEDQRRGKAIDALKLELKGLKEGSQEHEKRHRELRRQTIDRQVWRQTEREAAMREHHRLVKEMYAEITKLIAAVAKQRDYHLVIFHEPQEIDSKTSAELLSRIAGRKVLYADRRFDITPLVLRQLNDAYRAAKP